MLLKREAQASIKSSVISVPFHAVYVIEQPLLGKVVVSVIENHRRKGKCYDHELDIR